MTSENRAQCSPCSGLLEFHLRLLQPVRHPHLAVHRRRGSEVLLCLLALAGSAMKRAETEVAVGQERVQAQLVGRGQRSPIVVLGAIGPSISRGLSTPRKKRFTSAVSIGGRARN